MVSIRFKMKHLLTYSQVTIQERNFTSLHYSEADTRIFRTHLGVRFNLR